jgi:hypothetical protein
MKTIDKNSLASLEFDLRWQSDKGEHRERYLAQHVNFWRDIIPGELYQSLMGKKIGDHIEHTFFAGDIASPFLTSRVLNIANRQFVRRVINGRNLEPRYGRYYPSGVLKGVAGVYPDSLEPFRCIGVEDTGIDADFNHPMAKFSVDLRVQIKDITEKPGDRGGRLTDWMEEVAKGPGMQIRTNGQPTDFFSDNPFERTDENQDHLFYTKPRIVSHLDEKARAQISRLYETLVKPGTDVLDLMSSWQSHVPDSLELSSLVGLGMNEEELKKNPQLTKHIIHDLNQDPMLPFDSDSFDAVICAASVEYLTRPFDVFNEVARVLKPGGQFINTFSNRWFPPKAIVVWSELTEFERMGLVTEYYLDSGQFDQIHTYSTRGWPRPETDPHYGEFFTADPVYAVWGSKKEV